MHEWLYDKGINWATDYTDREKNGALIVKEEYRLEDESGTRIVPPLRTRWVSKGAWKFTEDKDKLLAMIPKYE